MAVKERTETDILTYIQRHAVGGKLIKSLLEIADEVGYSNATVHRTLTRFQTRGLVDIDREGRKANEPSVIYYKGPDPESMEQVLREGAQLADNLRQSADALIAFLEENTRNMELNREDAEAWRAFQRRIIHSATLPHNMTLVTIRTEDGP